MNARKVNGPRGDDPRLPLPIDEVRKVVFGTHGGFIRQLVRQYDLDEDEVFAEVVLSMLAKEKGQYDPEGGWQPSTWVVNAAYGSLCNLHGKHARRVRRVAVGLRDDDDDAVDGDVAGWAEKHLPAPPPPTPEPGIDEVQDLVDRTRLADPELADAILLARAEGLTRDQIRERTGASMREVAEVIRAVRAVTLGPLVVPVPVVGTDVVDDDDDLHPWLDELLALRVETGPACPRPRGASRRRSPRPPARPWSAWDSFAAVLVDLGLATPPEAACM